MLHTPVSSASMDSGPILHITGTGTFITSDADSEPEVGSGPGSPNARRQSATFERQSSVIVPQQKKKRFSLGSNSPVLSLLRMEGISTDVGVVGKGSSSAQQLQPQQRISVSVNITPVELLPPSPPLTRVGSNESLEKRMRELEDELTGGGHRDARGDIGDSEDEEDEVEMGRGRGVLEDLERERPREDDSSSDASWPNRLPGLGAGAGADINPNISQAHGHATPPQGDESFVAEMDIADTADTIEGSTASHGVTTMTMTSSGGADSGIGSSSVLGRTNSPPPAPSTLRNSILGQVRERVTDSLPTPTVVSAAGIAAGIVGVGIKPVVPVASASATTSRGFIGARALTGVDAATTTVTGRRKASAGNPGGVNVPASSTVQSSSSTTTTSSPLTTTREHPLYRPPSPQPWELLDPPATNNIRALGVGQEFGVGVGGSGGNGIGNGSAVGEKGKEKDRTLREYELDGGFGGLGGSKESTVVKRERYVWF